MPIPESLKDQIAAMALEFSRNNPKYPVAWDECGIWVESEGTEYGAYATTIIPDMPIVCMIDGNGTIKTSLHHPTNPNRPWMLGGVVIQKQEGRA